MISSAAGTQWIHMKNSKRRERAHALISSAAGTQWIHMKNVIGGAVRFTHSDWDFDEIVNSKSILASCTSLCSLVAEALRWNTMAVNTNRKRQDKRQGKSYTHGSPQTLGG